MHMMLKIPAYLLIVSLLFYAGLVRAQTTNGSISGRVTDPSHAVITDARVAAVNAGTNFRYETATNNSGEYYLDESPSGQL